MIHWFKSTKEYPEYWNEYSELFNNHLPKTFEEARFVVLDTETTGFDFKKDRILSIGCIAITDMTIKINDGLELYLEQEHFNPDTVKIHGLLKKESEECLVESGAMKQLLSYIGNSVVVAHHAGFDLGMINMALKRMGLPKLKNKVLDTMNLYRKTLINSNIIKADKAYSLDDLIYAFDLDSTDRHTASGDAYITAVAFLMIVQKLRTDKNLKLSDLL